MGCHGKHALHIHRQKERPSYTDPDIAKKQKERDSGSEKL